MITSDFNENECNNLDSTWYLWPSAWLFLHSKSPQLLLKSSFWIPFPSCLSPKSSFWLHTEITEMVIKEILETATLKEYLNSNHYLNLVTSPHPSTNIFYHLCLKTTESERVAVISTHKQFSTWRHKFLCIRLFRGFLDLRCGHRYLWVTFPLRTGIVQKQMGSYPPCGSRGGVVVIALASHLPGPGSI